MSKRYFTRHHWKKESKNIDMPVGEGWLPLTEEKIKKLKTAIQKTAQKHSDLAADTISLFEIDNDNLEKKICELHPCLKN